MSVFSEADEYLAGLRCTVCHSRVFGEVCPCQRERSAVQAEVDVDEWLESVKGQLSERELEKVLASSMAALSRQRRRAGWQHVKANTVGDWPWETGDCTVDEDLRAAFRQRHDVESHARLTVKWHPSRSRWTPKADQEPV